MKLFGDYAGITRRQMLSHSSTESRKQACKGLTFGAKLENFPPVVSR